MLRQAHNGDARSEQVSSPIKHLLPSLPYKAYALEPYISAETLEYHHSVHHDSYVRKLNGLVTGTRYAGMSLEEIIRQAPPGPICNNAVQAWNHAFYWHSMSADGGGCPDPVLADAIKQWFGSLDCFKQVFEKACLGLMGSGWVWLVLERDGRLAIHALKHAGINPLGSGQQPLLVCDLWEHAYYLDHRSKKTRYLHAFWELVNWDFAAANLIHPSHLESRRVGSRPEAVAAHRHPDRSPGAAASRAA